MVDIGIQSETEDLSDIESNAQQSGSRKPSFLQVVPEEEHEDGELVNYARIWHSFVFIYLNIVNLNTNLNYEFAQFMLGIQYVV